MDGQQRIALVETLTVGDEPDAASSSELIRYQLGNHLQSTSAEVDAEGHVLSYEEYFPFGSTSYLALDQIAAPGLQRYRYVGKEKDEESRLYYYGARYYVAWLGRWGSTDPAGIEDGVNLFSYVNNNPVYYIDFNGKYGVPGHYYTVYFTSLAVGMSGDDARINAFFSYLPDLVTDFDAIHQQANTIAEYKGIFRQEENEARRVLRNRRHNGLHALTGGSAVNERNVREQALRNQVPGTLGWGLASHAFGDAYAHTRLSSRDAKGMIVNPALGWVPDRFKQRTEEHPESNPRMYEAGWGHGAHNDVPDLIERRPDLYIEYAERLYDIYSSKTSSPALSKAEYLDVIRRVASLATAEEQIDLLRLESGNLGYVDAYAPEKNTGGLMGNIAEAMTPIDLKDIRNWHDFKNSTYWPSFIPPQGFNSDEVDEFAKQWAWTQWHYTGEQ